MKIQVGVADPFKRPWLEGAKDLVGLAPPESPSDTFVLRTVLQNDQNHRQQVVLAEIDGQPLPRLPDNQRPVQAQPLAEDRQEVVTVCTPKPQSPLSQPLVDGWFIASQTTRVIEDGKLGAEFHVQDSPQGYSEQVKLLQQDGEFESRQVFHCSSDPENCPQEMQRAEAQTVESILAWDAALSDRSQLLQSRYGHLKNASIFELGPFTTTVVARTLLSEENGNTYVGMDVNPVALRKQREALNSVGGYAAEHVQQIQDNFSRGAPVGDGSQDLVVAYSAFGLGDEASKAIRDLKEVHRILKPGGEFLNVGWGLEDAAPRTIAYALDHFEVAGAPGVDRGVILRKKVAE